MHDPTGDLWKPGKARKNIKVVEFHSLENMNLSGAFKTPPYILDELGYAVYVINNYAMTEALIDKHVIQEDLRFAYKSLLSAGPEYEEKLKDAYFSTEELLSPPGRKPHALNDPMVSIPVSKFVREKIAENLEKEKRKEYERLVENLDTFPLRPVPYSREEIIADVERIIEKNENCSFPGVL